LLQTPADTDAILALLGRVGTNLDSGGASAVHRNTGSGQASAQLVAQYLPQEGGIRIVISKCEFTGSSTYARPLFLLPTSANRALAAYLSLSEKLVQLSPAEFQRRHQGSWRLRPLVQTARGNLSCVYLCSLCFTILGRPANAETIMSQCNAIVGAGLSRRLSDGEAHGAFRTLRKAVRSPLLSRDGIAAREATRALADFSDHHPSTASQDYAVANMTASVTQARAMAESQAWFVRAAGIGESLPELCNFAVAALSKLGESRALGFARGGPRGALGKRPVSPPRETPSSPLRQLLLGSPARKRRRQQAATPDERVADTPDEQLLVAGPDQIVAFRYRAGRRGHLPTRQAAIACELLAFVRPRKTQQLCWSLKLRWLGRLTPSVVNVDACRLPSGRLPVLLVEWGNRLLDASQEDESSPLLRAWWGEHASSKAHA